MTLALSVEQILRLVVYRKTTTKLLEDTLICHSLTRYNFRAFGSNERGLYSAGIHEKTPVKIHTLE